jgi:5,10-methylenetetrahydrofolate reductase
MLAEKLLRREGGMCVYGITPPKRASTPESLAEIARHQRERLAALGPDGVVVYDISDESDRNAQPRPFPFFPLVDAAEYAERQLGDVPIEKIVYRCVHRLARAEFLEWLSQTQARPRRSLSVLVGAPSRTTAPRTLDLSAANVLARDLAPKLVLGGIAIAERHATRGDEHERLMAKMDQGCRFFVSQTVYDASSTKSLLSDYALLLAANERAPVPILFTVAPCGSVKTLEFMKWLGIAFPRWLENDLRHAADPLEQSIRLCERQMEDVLDFAARKNLPVGINVESVSIRKAEIEASAELFARMKARLRTAP